MYGVVRWLGLTPGEARACSGGLTAELQSGWLIGEGADSDERDD